MRKNISVIQQRLGNYDLPHIWTIDFILDTPSSDGADRYVLGEINASCVGFSTHLELSEDIADEIVRLMEAEAVVNPRWMAFSIAFDRGEIASRPRRLRTGSAGVKSPWSSVRTTGHTVLPAIVLIENRQNPMAISLDFSSFTASTSDSGALH